MIALIARWTVPAEHRDAVLEALTRMSAAVTANEPGCLMYHANLSNGDPNVIVLYERYVDEDALAAHRDADHFKAIVEGEIVPLLEKREREFLTPVI